MLEIVRQGPRSLHGPSLPRRPLGPRKTTSTFLPRHSHTLARAPRTFSAFPAHVARLLPTRTHARWSLILHNCIFYRPYQTSLTIGHFICKLPKNNVANVCAILEGAEPPIASPSASVMAALFALRRHSALPTLFSAIFESRLAPRSSLLVSDSANSRQTYVSLQFQQVILTGTI